MTKVYRRSENFCSVYHNDKSMGSQRIKLNCKKGVLELSPIDFRFQFSSSESRKKKFFTLRYGAQKALWKFEKRGGVEKWRTYEVVERRKKVLVSIEKQINCGEDKANTSLAFAPPFRASTATAAAAAVGPSADAFLEQKVLNLSAFSADSFRNT
jgi:hypothetical protein